MKKFLILSLSLLALFFTSCKGEANITLKENGSVSFSFSGQLGEAFKEMMGDSGSSLSNIDKEGIKEALEECGFESINVNVEEKTNTISISFEDEGNDSYLFSEEIIKVDGKEIYFSLTKNQFVALYNSSGEEIQSLLDLFISPVLNDEEMSEEEYVETINVTYGEETGNELKESSVNFTLTDKNKKSRSKSIFATSIFCGSTVEL